ncbi:hypothetical protein WME89_25685 [Sorangium sp. So ce321]|uniref:hypothetical protein n=1 Tax=Sorangium sp. So ce321 TaxID=3133300 RepID=UPI003F60C865
MEERGPRRSEQRRLDQEHALVYFQLVWNGSREPMQQALEALIMERQIEGEATFPPLVQKLIDRGELEGMRAGELKGQRDTLHPMIGCQTLRSGRSELCTADHVFAGL